MDFTLTQLETLVCVADVGNMTRAAEKLSLTQPAVTQQIHALERQVKMPLIEIVGRHPELTDAGRYLIERAREVLAEVAAIKRDLYEYSQAQIGSLHIGASLTIGTYLLPEILAQFRQHFPLIHMQIEIANTAAIIAKVRTGMLGIALIEGSIEENVVTSFPFQNDELVLIVSPHHHLAKETSIPLTHLSNEPLIMREIGSGTRELVEQSLAHINAPLHIALEIPSGEGVVRAVEAGLGIALVSRLIAHDAITSGRVVEVTIKDIQIQRQFQAVIMTNRVRSPVVEAFLAMLLSPKLIFGTF